MRIITFQMGDIIKFIEECVYSFYCNLNYGKSNTAIILPYCRPSVEKFIFNKLNFLLYDIYNIKFTKENTIFSAHQKALQSNYSIVEILDYLHVYYTLIQINDKFRPDFTRTDLPYKSCVDCLNKIQFEISPKEKIDSLMKASLELRNCILDISKGNV